MQTIYILTICDLSDFAVKKHESAHATESAAYAYAEKEAMPAVEKVTDPEWHHALETKVRTVRFFGEAV